MNAPASESNNDPFAGSRLLRVIAEGTAAATGDGFFRSLARHAAQALRARYAFVARSLSDLESQSLAYWEGADFGTGFSYRFPGTPCQNVAAGHVCATRTGLRERFPEDRWLTDIGADSYVGVPMKNAAGRTLGHIAVLHTEPMQASEEEIAVLEIFAARACAELERLQADEELRRRSLEQEAVLAVNRAVGRHLERAELFGALAACLQDVLGHDRFGIELPLEGDRLEGHLLSSGGSGPPVTRLKVLPVAGTACHWVLENRQWLVASTRDELAERFPATFLVMAEEGMESLAALPLVSGDRARGVLFFMAAARGAYDQVRRGFIEQVAGAVAAALDNCLAHEELRRQSKLALAESEERFRDLFDEAPIAYVNEGLDSRFIRANRAALRILGLRPEEVAGTYGKTFAPDTPDAQQRMREAFESIGRGTHTSGVVLELRRRDNGKPIWIQWWSHPAPDGQYTRTMFIDITERVLIEQEKARLEAQNTYLQEEILA